MNKLFLITFWRSCSGNLKSKFQNLKWLVLATFLLTTVSLVETQQTKRIPRIGFLSSVSPMQFAHLKDAFLHGLRELGYVEGNNIVIEWRWAEGQIEQLPKLAAELVRLKVDIIVAVTNPGIEAVKRATQTIPIVISIGSDPVGAGFVASLARPGGNITGLSAYSAELNGKRLEILKETVPTLSRVALLISPSVPGNAIDLKETELAARSLRLRIQTLEVRGSTDLGHVFKSMTKERAEALVVFPGQPTLFSNRKQLVELAEKNRLAAMYPLADYVDAGGLMSYGVSNVDLFRRAATFVDKILKGAKPADLPVEQPMKFEFVINLKTAKQIGLTVPPNVLARADRVIR
jgi:putative ABC transport system substrate-binding protein